MLGSIEKLHHEMIVMILLFQFTAIPVAVCRDACQDSEAWALNSDSRKVHWLVGMAGTGKLAISQSFCEILDTRL